MRSLVVLHDTLATELSRYLSAFLRTSIEVSKSSMESISFGEFLQPFPEPAYVASVITQPPEAIAVLAMEMQVVFSILDLLLGGEGKAEILTRDITEIEEEVLESVIRIICRELERAFHQQAGHNRSLLCTLIPAASPAAQRQVVAEGMGLDHQRMSERLKVGLGEAFVHSVG